MYSKIFETASSVIDFAFLRFSKFASKSHKVLSDTSAFFSLFFLLPSFICLEKSLLVPYQNSTAPLIYQRCDVPFVSPYIAIFSEDDERMGKLPSRYFTFILEISMNY